MFMDQCDFMDCFDEDLAAVFGHDLQNTVSPGSNSISSSTVINIPGSNSINSFYNSPGLEQTKQHTPVDNPKFSTMHNMASYHDQASSAPIILNFGSQNLSENVQQVRH